MKKIAVFIADGTEEIECLTPVDVLRRAGAQVDLISVSGNCTKCSHGISIVADQCVENVNLNIYDCLVVPGGMPGAVNISNNNSVIKALKTALESQKLVCAICASPAVVIAGNDLLKDRKATCYPAKDFIDAIGKNYTTNDVEIDGNLITANGPKSAMEFSLKIAEALGLNPKF